MISNQRGSIEKKLLLCIILSIVFSLSVCADVQDLRIDSRVLQGVQQTFNPFTLKRSQTKAEPESLVVLASLYQGLSQDEIPPREYQLSNGTTIYLRGRQIALPYRPLPRSPWQP